MKKKGNKKKKEMKGKKKDVKRKGKKKEKKKSSCVWFLCDGERKKREENKV